MTRPVIFLTVGAQMPFERLVRAVDAWAAASGRRDVFAQIGDSSYRPKSMMWVPELPPQQFRERLAGASAVVAHAGMGTILTARQLGKPILVLPRLARLGETRNDHQVATAKRLFDMGWVQVASDEHDLAARLDAVDALAAGVPIEPFASGELIGALREFIRAS